jgi:PAS domain S-box-containing protein
MTQDTAVRRQPGAAAPSSRGRRVTRGGLTRQVLALGMAVAAVLAVVLVVVLYAISAVDRASDARARTAHIVTVGVSTEKAVLDMETGLRGYWLTDQRRFLAPWLSGRTAFALDLARLEALTAHDGSDDDAVVRSIARQGDAYVKRYGEQIAAQDPSGVARERVIAAALAGKRRVDALRGRFERLEAINTAHSQGKLDDAAAAVARARAAVVIGLLAVLALIALGVLYLVRKVSSPMRRIATIADALSGGDLTARAPVEGPGEVAQLAVSFNAMAASIQDGLRTVQVQNEHLESARAEAEVTATELAAQQELAVDLVATVGFDGYFKRVNPAWERTLGYPAAELRSRPFIDYVHPDDRERTEAEAARLERMDVDAINFENRYRTAGGAYRWLEWNARPIAEQGLLYAVARDVTERKDADEEVRAARDAAERANLAKSEFLSRMSHELRTPLNAILGFGQLLEMDGLERQQHESVEQILRAGRHLLELIDEVLDISRIEAGSMRMSVEPVDVVSALGDAVALIAPVATAAGIELHVEPGGEDECYVLADRQRLRQVILNLLSNAVKYNRPGGTVTVSTACRCDDDRVRVNVADTGLGIPKDQLERLFVAFDRLDAAVGPVQGTGLGLTLSKNLTEAMGGALCVESVPGEGSRFTIELLSADDPVDGTGFGADQAPGESLEGLGSRTILYIEDNPANGRLVARALAGHADLRLFLALQGSRGLELAKAHQPDLILLDLHLPDMEGRAVLDRLRADPETADLPVVILSADATQRHVPELLAAGASTYLTKPLNIPDFLEVVNRHLPAEVA